MSHETFKEGNDPVGYTEMEEWLRVLVDHENDSGAVLRLHELKNKGGVVVQTVIDGGTPGEGQLTALQFQERQEDHWDYYD